jgi:TRAP-type C4-dicarboxylate transport system permease small subunit
VRGRRQPFAETARQGIEYTRKAMEALDTVMGIVGGALFFIIAWYIVFDVLGRNYTGLYSRATDEISGYALAMGTTWAMAFALRKKGHVTIDVLTGRLPTRVQDVLNLIALAVMLLFAAVLARFTWLLAIGSFKIHATSTGMIGTPLFLPQAMMAIGFSILGLEAVVLLATGLVEQLLRIAAPAAASDPGAATEVSHTGSFGTESSRREE